MARHNRNGSGTDRCGDRYEVSYHPDWLRCVKVSRQGAFGRRSARTLVSNREARPLRRPSDRVRTRITLPGSGQSIELLLKDPGAAVTDIVLTCQARLPNGEVETLNFKIEGGGIRAEA